MGLWRKGGYLSGKQNFWCSKGDLKYSTCLRCSWEDYRISGSYINTYILQVPTSHILSTGCFINLFNFNSSMLQLKQAMNIFSYLIITNLYYRSGYFASKLRKYGIKRKVKIWRKKFAIIMFITIRFFFGGGLVPFFQ